MKTSSNIGFHTVDGPIRQLSIRERLQQISLSRQSGELNHPLLGKITITNGRADELLSMYSEEKLIGLSSNLFMPKGEEKLVEIKNRLEELRTELRAERISIGELNELQSLAKYIDSSDVELLEAAGVPEFSYDDKIQSFLAEKYPNNTDEKIGEVSDEEYNDIFFKMVDDVRLVFNMGEDGDNIANSIVESYMSN